MNASRSSLDLAPHGSARAAQTSADGWRAWLRDMEA